MRHKHRRGLHHVILSRGVPRALRAALRCAGGRGRRGARCGAGQTRLEHSRVAGAGAKVAALHGLRCRRVEAVRRADAAAAPSRVRRRPAARLRRIRRAFRALDRGAGSPAAARRARPRSPRILFSRLRVEGTLRGRYAARRLFPHQDDAPGGLLRSRSAHAAAPRTRFRRVGEPVPELRRAQGDRAANGVHLLRLLLHAIRLRRKPREARHQRNRPPGRVQHHRRRRARQHPRRRQGEGLREVPRGLALGVRRGHRACDRRLVASRRRAGLPRGHHRVFGGDVRGPELRPGATSGQASLRAIPTGSRRSGLSASTSVQPSWACSTRHRPTRARRCSMPRASAATSSRSHPRSYTVRPAATAEAGCWRPTARRTRCASSAAKSSTPRGPASRARVAARPSSPHKANTCIARTARRASC